MAGHLREQSHSGYKRRMALGLLFVNIAFLGLMMGTGFSAPAPQGSATPVTQPYSETLAATQVDDLVPATSPAVSEIDQTAPAVAAVTTTAQAPEAPVPAAIATTNEETSEEKVHEAVYTWAEDHPGEPVPVIVQASGDAEALVAAIHSLGGTVERELELVQALDIRLPANRVGALAGDPSVAWISLDAPLVAAHHDGTNSVHVDARTPTATPEPEETPIAKPEATPAPEPEPTPAPAPEPTVAPPPAPFFDAANVATAYPFAVNAPSVWNAETPRTGVGVGVAIIDTGISNAGNPDFLDSNGVSRVVAEVAIRPGVASLEDGYGHGTHLAGIVGGDGDQLPETPGKYVGIAPHADLIDIKISDDAGNSSVSDAIVGIQWAVNNQALYNIRVLNLSLHSSVKQSYKTDPLDEAVEFAWTRGIVVVTSSGNMGSVPDAVSYAPANDPFVIVVGATDDAGTADRSDDTIATFSSRGVTQNGFRKPDVVAPGRKIVSTIEPNSVLANTYPDRFVDGSYFRMSGTSMAAPVVSGLVALMLEQNPALTPGQVKYILTRTSEPLAIDPSNKVTLADAATFFRGEPGDTDEGLTPARQVRKHFAAKLAVIAHVLGATDPITGLPTVQAEAALIGLNLGAVCPGVLPSQCTLATVNWEAIKWNAIKWNAIKWNAIKWNAIKWNAIKWNAIKWNAIKWNAIKWGSVDFLAIKWNEIQFDAIKWNDVGWDAMTAEETGTTGVAFDSTEFDSTVFDSVGFDSVRED